MASNEYDKQTIKFPYKFRKPLKFYKDFKNQKYIAQNFYDELHCI